MAISKRARFEILRRDGFRCHYCGTRGNETTGAGLTIDHVVPTTLGGSDDPTNLVAACRDCNSGKSSVPADAELVAEVSRTAEIHKAARVLALQALEADLLAESDYISEVWDAWYATAPSYASDPDDLESIAESWFKRGVPLALVAKACRISWAGPAAKHLKARYAAGVVNRLMEDAEDRAKSLAAGDNLVFQKGYDDGFHDGQDFYAAFIELPDLIAMHVDGRTDTVAWSLAADYMAEPPREI